VILNKTGEMQTQQKDLPVSAVSVVENSTVRARDSSAVGGHASEVGGAGDLDTGKFVSLGVLLKVLNGEFATGGLDLHELVSLGSV
jgi:hypothetical protein